MRFRRTMAKLEPGDFLAFHSCLPHRSTLPRKLLASVTGEDLRLNVIDPPPRDRTKFVVYWDACRARIAGRLLDQPQAPGRGRRTDQPDAVRFHAAEAVAMNYPDDYPTTSSGWRKPPASR